MSKCVISSIAFDSALYIALQTLSLAAVCMHV